MKVSDLVRLGASLVVVVGGTLWVAEGLSWGLGYAGLVLLGLGLLAALGGLAFLIRDLRGFLGADRASRTTRNDRQRGGTP